MSCAIGNYNTKTSSLRVEARRDRTKNAAWVRIMTLQLMMKGMLIMVLLLMTLLLLLLILRLLMMTLMVEILTG